MKICVSFIRKCLFSRINQFFLLKNIFDHIFNYSYIQFTQAKLIKESYQKCQATFCVGLLKNVSLISLLEWFCVRLHFVTFDECHYPILWHNICHFRCRFCQRHFAKSKRVFNYQLKKIFTKNFFFVGTRSFLSPQCLVS